jgi:hypothetical protein
MQATHPVLFADSKAPFDTVAKNGYYQVGNQFFNHKISALIEATKTNQSVQWHFNDPVWNKINWRSNDSIPVTYWYQERAKQLRDKYDYLILAFSGGRDSHNVLHSFIDNDIHLDEVWCDWPLQHTEGKFDLNPHDCSPENMPSEWTYSIKPELDRLAQSHSLTKITITDSTSTLADENAEDTLMISQYAFYATVKRFRELDTIVRQRSKKYARVGVIVGIEKPQYLIINGFMSLFFSDSTMQIKSDSIGDCTREVEYFYWSADLPELVRSQGHAILDYLRANPWAQQLQSFASIKNNLTVTIDTPEQSQAWRNLINYAIYPQWDNKFQVAKPIDFLYNNEYYSWLTSHQDLRALQSHRNALDNSLKLVDHRFFKKAHNNAILNYKPFTTKFLPVGKLENLLD